MIRDLKDHQRELTQALATLAGVPATEPTHPPTWRSTSILAAVAQDEARRISERTKDALAAAKRRGVQLGATRPECRNLTDEAYADLQEFLAALRPAFSYQHIADILNQRGERTRRGKPWTDVAVLRACRRLGISHH